MKFQISRTSLYLNRPCEEAIKGTYIPVDRRTFKTPEEHDARFPHMRWSSNGSNHRIVEGNIERDMPPASCWLLEISDLQQLIELSKKYGDLVFSPDRIEIYDGYRE